MSGNVSYLCAALPGFFDEGSDDDHSVGTESESSTEEERERRSRRKERRYSGEEEERERSARRKQTRREASGKSLHGQSGPRGSQKGVDHQGSVRPAPTEPSAAPLNKPPGPVDPAPQPPTPEPPKERHLDKELWQRATRDFQGGAAGKYKEALGQPHYSNVRSMLLRESRKGCGNRSTGPSVVSSTLDKRTLIWGPESGDAVESRTNLDQSRQGRRVVVAACFPWIDSSKHGCKVPQFAELLRAEHRSGAMEEKAQHPDFESFRKSPDWNGLNPWDYECYGQIDPKKASIWFECVICPLWKEQVKGESGYKYASQGLKELGKHALTNQHQDAAVWVEAGAKKSAVRFPTTRSKPSAGGRKPPTTDEQRAKKLQAAGEEPGQLKLSFPVRLSSGAVAPPQAPKRAGASAEGEQGAPETRGAGPSAAMGPATYAAPFSMLAGESSATPATGGAGRPAAGGPARPAEGLASAEDVPTGAGLASEEQAFAN